MKSKERGLRVVWGPGSQDEANKQGFKPGFVVLNTVQGGWI